MVQLGILLTQQHRLLSVAAMLDVFETANRFSEEEKQPPLFGINLLHPDHSPAIAYSGHPMYTLKAAPRQDVILIPAFNTDDISKAIQVNAACIAWLGIQYKKGTEIASFCTGAFLLAATGLLNDKPATTHIQAANAFAQAFPQVHLKEGEVSTHEQGIYTSGGATNSFYLMFRLLEKYCNHELTVKVAKYFAVDMNRGQQIYFSTFKHVATHKDPIVSALQERIQQQYEQAVTIEDLMTEIPASRRNLVRRFKAATGLTPIEYLQKTRVEAAKNLLEQTDRTILDIMLRAGYNDLKAFRQLFRKITGLTPTAYREKFYCKKEIALSPQNMVH